MKYNFSACATVFCGLVALFEIHQGSTVGFTIDAILCAINSGFSFGRKNE
jgi:hypothetical protein